jgi:phage/plasmid-like protein (TIGR03299 family)
MGMVPDTFGEMSSFASLRVPAWHMLGTVTDKALGTEEFKKLANVAGLNERKVHCNEIGAKIPFANDEYFVVRTNPFTGTEEILSGVGGRYEVFTSDELFALGEYMTDGAFRWETMGAMGNGTSVFGSLVHTDDIVLDPNGAADVIKRFLVLHTTHDGSGNVRAKETPVRVVCQNTLDAAFGSTGTVYKIRHTKNMRDRLEEAKKIMGFAAAYDEVFEAEAQALFAASVTDAQFTEMVLKAYPKPDDKKGAITKWVNKVDGYKDIWNGSTGSMDNLPKNAWRAWQAFTEYDQWNRQVRDGNIETFAKAGAGFDDLTSKARTSALVLVKEMAGV